MSEYVHGGRRSRLRIESKTVESRTMFAACIVLFLIRAIAVRMMPWREQAFFRRSPNRESIFSEARREASLCVASSFMGL
jgi:hypothetical protein